MSSLVRQKALTPKIFIHECGAAAAAARVIHLKTWCWMGGIKLAKK
jgi:hypothetical protein